MEKESNGEKRKTSIVRRIPFLLTLCFTLLLVGYAQYTAIRQECVQMDYIARSIGSETYETILSQLSKTRVLEAHLIQTDGQYDDFASIAEVLLQENYVRNVLFAPDGIVKSVFPLVGNESVIGLDMNHEGAGNKEARAAMEKGELYMAGPFELVQGGLGIAGRLPVYLETNEGERYFWGIASVTLDYPEVLQNSSIDGINEQGFACRMWRVNPDTGEEQSILSTKEPISDGAKTLDYDLQLFNSTWTLSVAPLTVWYARGSLWLGVVASILMSLLVRVATSNLEKVRRMKAEEANRQISELQRQLEREQTGMLLSQISSHFFYHTLNALQALIVLQPEAAYKMAGDFSRYLRFNVDSITASDGIGSFKQELRAVRAYADINQQQLGERLNVVFDVPDVDFDIPVLTIEPIVENAILHGIKPKVGGGNVTICLEDGGDYWRVLVIDDGVGFAPDSAAQGQSIGLGNVRRRIAQFEGCEMHMESRPNYGTKVELNYTKILRMRA